MTRLFLLLLLAAPLFAAESSHDWPRYRGPNGDGISVEHAWSSAWPKEGPQILWKAEVGVGFSSFAVRRGRVYTVGHASDFDSVYCFEAASGNVLWKHAYPQRLDPNNYEGGPNATPTVEGSCVYVLGRDGDLFCLDAEKGTELWKTNIVQATDTPRPKWGHSGSPAVHDKLLILNNGASGMAVDKTNGQVLWKSVGKAGYATPVFLTVGGKAASALFSAEGVALVEVDTGKVLMKHPWKTSWDVNAADPIVSGDKIFLSSGYDAGCVLLQIGAGLKEVWKNKNMRNQMSGCVLYQDHLYGFDENQLRCLEFKTGAVKWSQDGLGKGTLMVADGKLVVLDESGKLVIAEAAPTAYKQLAVAHVLGGRCWTPPVLSNGRIYARNAKGNVVCVEVGGK